MRIFITGGRGMVGRNLINSLHGRGHEVVAPSRAELNLRDKHAVLAFVRDWIPDLIIHAAGRVGGIAANMADPYGFLIENLEIGANVAEAAVAGNVHRLLNLGSSCIYPKDVEGELREEMILSGPLESTNEGYAIAKITMLRLCEFASQSERFRYKTLIPCNLYGRFDHFDVRTAHLVPAIIRKVHEAMTSGADTVEIWGDGSARREFMFAGDLAGFMCRAVDAFDDLPNLMNVGIGQDHSVLEYYQAVSEVVGWNGSFTFDLTKPAGMRRKLVNVDRQKAWGWQPETSLRDGIRETYNYFLSVQQS